MATPTYEPIAVFTTTGTAARVTISNLPNTFRDIVIVFNGKATPNTAYLDYDINGDTNDANYKAIIAQGNGSSLYNDVFTGNNSGPWISNDDSMFRLELMDYSTTNKHKLGIWRNAIAGGMAQMGHFRWANTNAITSIAFYDSSGESIASGSQFSVWGVAA